MSKAKHYVVTHKDGTRALVKAQTAAGALAFKRAQVVLDAHLATQDELLAMAGSVKVEDATQE